MPKSIILKGMRWLSICWLMGICVFGWAEDKKPALRYSEDLRQQAEKGDDDAQFQLGDCYFFGLGIPKDQVEGVSWYRKAAAQGYRPSQKALQSLGDDGSN